MEYHLAKIAACAFGLLAFTAVILNGLTAPDCNTAHKTVPYWVNVAALGVSVYALLKLAGCC